jgi:hypothetical protein
MRYMVLGHHLLRTDSWDSSMDCQVLKIVAEQNKDIKLSLHKSQLTDIKDDKANALG